MGERIDNENKQNALILDARKWRNLMKFLDSLNKEKLEW